MMITNPLRNGKRFRPSWNYQRDVSAGGATPSEYIDILEMLESIRNVLEAIHGSQMLQCDVAHAIKRIDRRLSKLEGMKLK